jgi:hypothetical protein
MINLNAQPVVIEAKDVTDLKYSPREQRKVEWLLKIGSRINALVEPVRELAFLEHRYAVRRARSPGARLTDDEVREYSAYMLDVQDRELRLAYFKNVDLSRTFQGLLVRLVDHVLALDLDCRSVVNVGVNFAFIDHVLANKYPNTSFTAVDFAANVAEFNENFQARNLKFISGYALDLLEAGKIDADVFIMSSVAYEIKSAELQNYFNLFARHGRYVVLNEPIYALPGGAIVDPASVSPDEARPVYSYRGRKRRKHGPLATAHNYKAMLERAGFEIVHYSVFKPEFTDVRMVNVVARSRQRGAPGAF